MTELLVRLFVKNNAEVRDKSVREGYGRLGGTVGITCNLLLCVIKILIGTLTASISIVADGLNNLSDMGSSIITMIGFKMAGKPADSDHPFGHGRMEYMSAFLVAMLILLVGFELLINSGKTLIAGEKAPVYSVWAIVVLSFSILIKFWMFLFNRKIGKRIASEALIATGQDSINDAIATLAILISVVVGMITALPFNLDAAMACLVALFIIKSGISTAKDTLDQILGGPPEKALIQEIEQTVMSFHEFVGIHDLLVHNYGPGRQFASVHVEVPQDIDIVHCHEQIDLCEKLVAEKTDVQLVIHMDPIDVNNETVKNTKHAMSNIIKQIDPRLTLHDFRMTPGGKTRTNLIFDVLVPDDVKLTHEQLNSKIGSLAREIDPTYCCVITYDHDFTGLF